MRKIYQDSIKAYTIAKLQWEKIRAEALQAGNEKRVVLCDGEIERCEQKISDIEDLMEQEDEQK